MILVNQYCVDAVTELIKNLPIDKLKRKKMKLAWIKKNVGLLEERSINIKRKCKKV